MITDFAANKVAGNAFNGNALAFPSTWWLALMTKLPINTGAAGVEVSGGNYGRVSLPAATANFTNTTGFVQTANDANFNQASADWGLVSGLALFDANTSGNMWFYGRLIPPIQISAGDPAFTVKSGLCTINFKACCSDE